MPTRLDTIRRLALASACWSTCATLVSLEPSQVSGADKNPAPRKLWTPINGRPGSATDSDATGTDVKVRTVANKKKTNTEDGDPAVHAADPARVKLNFLATPWPKVLEAVAEATDSKLVMMDEPSGRFSRQDWNGRYTRTDAVRILNRELEPLGYRLLEKNEFLTLINVHRQDREYQRPLVSAGSPERKSNRDIVRVDGEQTEVMGQVTNADLNIPMTEAAPKAAAPAEPAPAPEPVVRTFEPMNHSALQLSKQMLRAFEPLKRSTLVDEGPTGLPGFQVFAPPATPTEAKGDLQFVVELDTEQDRILVHGVPEVADRIHKLFSRLDRMASEKGSSVQLIPGDEQAALIAERIRPVVKQLAQFQQGAQGAGSATRPDADMAPAAPATGPDSDVVESPQGDVTVEVYEGNIILRGRTKDVDAVTRMIRSIETAAEGSLPEVNLVILEHAESRALAALVESVYTQLATLRNRTGSNNNQKQVTALPVVTPNAILLLAPQTQLDGAMEVVKKLDVPVSPESQMQVFSLRSAVASQVVEHITTLFVPESTNMSPTATAVADVRTNSVVVMARPRDMKTISDLVTKLDKDGSQAVITQKKFTLKYAVAQELAQFLSLSIQTVLNPPQQQNQQQGAGGFGGFGGGFGGGGSTQGAEELRTSKAVVLEFLSSDGNAERLVRSGLLSDVRILAEPRTNSLMVSAPEQSLPLLTELIHVLDQPSASVSEFKVITLENADAVAAAEVLSNLFSSTTQTGGQGQTAQGIQLAGAQDASSALVPVQVTADPRTNSIIASGGPAAMQLVEAIVARIDAPDSRNRQQQVVRLRNVAAQDVATALTGFLSSVRDLSSIDNNLITSNQLLMQEVIVTAEVQTNNLLVSATPRYMKDILRIINELDREPDQVMIQAILVQVDLTGNCELGVELGFQDSILFDRSSAAGLPGFGFNNNPLGNNILTPNPSKVGGQSLSNFSMGRTSTEAGFGGLVLSASSESVSVLIRALEANSNAQVLSRPSILAVDNQVAEITVGQIVPRPAGVTVSTGIATPNFQDTNVGIILSCIPRITPEGKIIMNLIANNSQLSGQSVPMFANADGSSVVSSPIINQSRAETTVKIPDGQTIVVGGMITSNDSQITRKVPWLGDLPVVGRAFRYDSNVNKRSELIIFLTPRIVRRDLDSEIIKQVEAERLNFFETDVEQMHGPIFGVPRPDWTADCPPEEIPIDPETGRPMTLPPGSIMPDGQSPTGPNNPSPQLDYVPTSPIPMKEAGTNSKRVRGEYGEAFGRRPLMH